MNDMNDNAQVSNTNTSHHNRSDRYDPAVTLPLLFPEPLNERFFLWAHQYEETEPGHWQHPGVSSVDDPILAEQGFYTAAQALEAAREMDRFYLMVINSGAAGIDPDCKAVLWHKGAYYQWLCAHGAGPDGEGICVASETVNAWAKGKLPE